MADGVLVVGELRPFGVDHAVEVHDAVTGLGHFCGGGRQHLGRVAAAVGRVGVREHAADIGQGGRAEQGVGHGMQQHVGVAVADELPVVRHIDAAQPQRPARLRAMTVFAESNPQLARGCVSSNCARFAWLSNVVNPRGL